jgi:hypothetical protein
LSSSLSSLPPPSQPPKLQSSVPSPLPCLAETIRPWTRKWDVSLPPSFVPTNEMISAIRRRPDVPVHLRCIACNILVWPPVWLECCDVVVCRACIGSATATLPCPACGMCTYDGTQGQDTGNRFHSISALLACASTWIKTTCIANDMFTT